MDIPDVIAFCKEHHLDMTFRSEWFMEADTVLYTIRIERDVRNGWATTREGDDISKVIEAAIASAKRFLEREVMND